MAKILTSREAEKYSQRNKRLEYSLFLLLFIQALIMSFTILTLWDQKIYKDESIRKLSIFLPVWSAALAPIIISRIKFGNEKNRFFLLSISLISALLLLGVSALLLREVLLGAWRYL